MVRTGQFAAKPDAFAAGLDAVIHLAQRCAVLGTSFAQLGAETGKAGMELALSSQGVGRKGAETRAIQHQAQMLRPGMFAAALEAIGHGHGVTHLMAMRERLDGGAGLLAELIHPGLSI